MTTKKFSTIDEYHASFPEDVQGKLDELRKTIKQVVPEAQEVISYNIPAFKLNKVVVYYAAFKKHISLFPAPTGVEWKKDFEPFHTSGKGTIQFRLDKPLPFDLIKKIVEYRIQTDKK